MFVASSSSSSYSYERDILIIHISSTNLLLFFFSLRKSLFPTLQLYEYNYIYFTFFFTNLYIYILIFVIKTRKIFNTANLMHSVSSAHFDFNLNIVGHSSSIGILLCTISSLSFNLLFMNSRWIGSSIQ